MKKYRVKALSVGGKNKIFNYGDVVTENNFPDGNAEKLVEQGFLEVVGKTDKTTAPINDKSTELDVDSLNKKQIISELEERKIEFNSRDDKSVLLELLKNNL